MLEYIKDTFYWCFTIKRVVSLVVAVLYLVLALYELTTIWGTNRQVKHVKQFASYKKFMHIFIPPSRIKI